MTAFPVVWVPLAGRVERFPALPSRSIKHALCTEYDVGAGIGWHRDKKHFDQVFGLSLASACNQEERMAIGGCVHNRFGGDIGVCTVSPRAPDQSRP